MPEFKPQLLALIGQVQDLLVEVPRCQAVLRDIEEGRLDVETGVIRLVEILHEEGLTDRIKGAASQLETLLPARGVQTPRPVMMQTSTGIPQLNPKIEAALIERASLDGDVPEFRSGVLPEGGHPAVPVVTTSLDPVYVGAQLQDASNEVLVLIGQAIEEREMTARALLDEVREGPDKEKHLAELRKSLPPVPTGVPGYEAGQLPELRQVAPPEALQLATLPSSERQRLAHRAIATTQGRLSLASPLARRVQAILQSRGHAVELGTPDPEITSWSWMTKVHGPRDIDDRFAFTEIAAAAMARHLLDVLPGAGEGPFVLEVTPRADISMRLFGWKVRLGKEPLTC